jgi:hypothetical protein
MHSGSQQALSTKELKQIRERLEDARLRKCRRVFTELDVELVDNVRPVLN